MVFFSFGARSLRFYFRRSAMISCRIGQVEDRDDGPLSHAKSWAAIAPAFHTFPENFPGNYIAFCFY